MITLLIIGLIILFFSGAPLFAVMLAATAIGALALPRDMTAEFGGPLLTTYGMGTKDEGIVFATIPLFIYSGYMMAAAKTADRLVRFSNAMLGWMPGGLAIVTIFACAVFTIFTGASGVTIVALGALVMPALIKQNYPEKFALGLVTGTGSVGLLFPPAIPLFVFGTVYGLNNDLKKKWDWDTERFLGAGLIPGLVLIGCLSVVAIAAAIYYKVPRQKFSFRELVRSGVVALPELILPFAIIIALVSGLASVPQVAGLTVVYLMILEMGVYRDIKPKTLWNIGTESLALVGTIFLVIYASSAFTNLLITAEIPQDLVKWTTAHVDSKIVFLLMLNLLLLAGGMMMDIFSAIIIVLPLVAGVADHYDVNPYHLGVIFLLNLEIGYLTPPVGLNLFIASFKFQKPVVEVTRATLPFIGAMLVALMLVTYIPALTWVPPPKRDSGVATLVALSSEAYLRTRTVGEIDVPGCRKVTKDFCATWDNMTDEANCYQAFIDVTACGEDTSCIKAATNSHSEDLGCDSGASLKEIVLPSGHKLRKLKIDEKGAEVEICEVCGKDGACAPIADDEGDHTNSEGCIELFGDIIDCTAKDSEAKVKECQDEKTEEFLEVYAEDILGVAGDGDGDDELDGGVEENEDQQDAGAEAGDQQGVDTGSGTGSGSGAAAPADELKLPNGKTIKPADCAKFEEDYDQEACAQLFTSVADCRKKADATCETEALATYVEDFGE